MFVLQSPEVKAALAKAFPVPDPVQSFIDITGIPASCGDDFEKLLELVQDCLPWLIGTIPVIGLDHRIKDARVKFTL